VPDGLRTALRLASGVVLLVALVAATHRTASDPTEGAVLAIAVRTMAGTLEECRPLSDEEMAALPMHMRREQACWTRAVPYRLVLRVNGEILLDRVYRAAGIHGDRPITVDERIRLASGTHVLDLRFVSTEDRVDPPMPIFALEGPIELEEGRIRVISLEDATRRFAIH
jgi:hypothetical protein